MPPLNSLPSLVISKPRDGGDDPFAAEPRQGAISYREAVANPGPLGLFAFALTTALLQGATTAITEPTATKHMVACFGMFYGGLAQLIAGIFDMKKGSTFGATAFCTYGSFWMGLSLFTILNAAGVWSGASSTGVAAPYSFIKADQCMLSLFGILTAIFFVGTLKINRALQVLFASLSTLFFLLAIGLSFPIVTKIAGWFGLYVAGVAFYTGAAELWNEVHGRQILPLGAVAKPSPARVEHPTGAAAA